MSEQDKIRILKDIFGQPRRVGKELIFHCPKCQHHKPKLSVNMPKNAFKCWVCDYRGTNIYRLIRRYGTFKQRQTWEMLDGRVDHSGGLTFEEKMMGLKEKEPEQRLFLPREFVSLANRKLPATAARPLKYLKDRGVTKADIIRWKIGYCNKGEYEGRVIVPSFNLDGKVDYFIARNFLGNWNSYKNPPVSKNLVFNHLYVDWNNDLTIVEGVFDAIVAGNAVPLLGSTLTEKSKLFQELAKHDTPIYIALDPDAEKKAKKLIRNLVLYGLEVHKVDVSGFKDVGEMTKEEFTERKKNASFMNPAAYLEYETKGIL